MDAIWFFWLLTIGIVHIFTFIPWLECSRLVKRLVESKPGELDQHTKVHLIKKRDEAWMNFLMIYHQISWCIIMLEMFTLVYTDNISGNARILAAIGGFAYALVTIVATYYRHAGGGDGLVSKLIFQMPEGCATCTSSIVSPSRRADIAYGVVMLQATTIGFAFSSCTSGADQVSAACRLFVSMINRKTNQAVWWNLLSITISMLLAYSGLMECRVRYLEFLLPEFLTLVLIVAATYIMEQLAIAEAGSATNARSQQNECAAFSAILNATCDAVVHLNAQGEIIGPTPKLASLLLYNNGAQTLDGKPFKILMATEQERETIDKLLTAAVDEEDGNNDFATAFRINVCDQAGSTVCTRGFHTRYMDMDGETGHLIGLSEVSDANKDGLQDRFAGDDQQFTSPSIPIHAARARATSGILESLQADLQSSLSVNTDDRWSSTTEKSWRSRSATADDGELVLPDFHATSRMAKEMTLWSTVLSWNFHMPRGSCCHFHAASRELRRVTGALARGPCLKSASLQTATAQCQACGLLNAKPCSDSDRCSDCVQWQPQRAAPPAGDRPVVSL